MNAPLKTEVLPATTVIDGVTYWYDQLNNQIHENNVSEIDKLRTDFVHKSMQDFKVQALKLKQFKETMWDELDSFLAVSASEYGKQYRGRKDGFTLETFNGQYRITVTVADYQKCDERINTAIQMIKECLRRWSHEGSNQNLHSFIEQKFALNDKGDINVREMLSLRRLKIDDDNWKEAMNIMTDSLFTTGSKSQLRFYERNAETGKYDIIKADFSAI